VEGDVISFDVVLDTLDVYVDEDVYLYRVPTFVWGEDEERYKDKFGDDVPHMKVCERGCISWGSSQVFLYDELYSPLEWGAPYVFDRNMSVWGCIDDTGAEII